MCVFVCVYVCAPRLVGHCMEGSYEIPQAAHISTEPKYIFPVTEPMPLPQLSLREGGKEEEREATFP